MFVLMENIIIKLVTEWTVLPSKFLITNLTNMLQFVGT